MHRALAVLASMGWVLSAAPTLATAFSAQDVITICQTTRSSPATVPALFLKQGWRQFADEEHQAATDLLSIAFLTGYADLRLDQPYSPSDWKQAWVTTKDAAASIVRGVAKDQWSLMIHDATGAFLAINTRDGTVKMGITCILTVPADAANQPTYHPKLPRPDSRGAFRATLETLDTDMTRTKIVTSGISVDPTAIDHELGIKTDIVAVFRSSISYPAWAVAE